MPITLAWPFSSRHPYRRRSRRRKYVVAFLPPRNAWLQAAPARRVALAARKNGHCGIELIEQTLPQATNLDVRMGPTLKERRISANCILIDATTLPE